MCASWISAFSQLGAPYRSSLQRSIPAPCDASCDEDRWDSRLNVRLFLRDGAGSKSPSSLSSNTTRRTLLFFVAREDVADAVAGAGLLPPPQATGAVTPAVTTSVGSPELPSVSPEELCSCTKLSNCPAGSFSIHFSKALFELFP